MNNQHDHTPATNKQVAIALACAISVAVLAVFGIGYLLTRDILLGTP